MQFLEVNNHLEVQQQRQAQGRILKIQALHVKESPGGQLFLP